MTKKYTLKGLGCANCAAKMETAIKKIKGVNDASISFLTQRLMLDADDEHLDEILASAAAACRRIEPDCELKY